MATYTFHMALANTLPNGAEILSRYFHPIQERWIILAWWEKGVGLPREYITWCSADDGDAYLGHYFKEFQRAEDDYNKRCQRGY